MDNEKSTFGQRHKADCLPCRFISGFGVIGIGIYLYSQAKHRPSKGGRFVLYTFAAGAASVGIARLSGFHFEKIRNK